MKPYNISQKMKHILDAYIADMGDNRKYEIKAQGDDEATIYLYDIVGYDFWTDGGVTAKQFTEDLAAIKAATIHLRINSPGGDVFEARAIQTALVQHTANVVAHIDGLAASAATYIMLAADEIEAVDGALLMIHDAWALVVGNKSDMVKMADTLAKIDEGIAADYVQKTGQSEKQINDWMAAETSFTAKEALEYGFIDRIYEAPKKNTKRDAEKALRDAGFSNSQSKKIVADGYDAINQRDVDSDELAAIISKNISTLKT